MFGFNDRIGLSISFSIPGRFLRSLAIRSILSISNPANQSFCPIHCHNAGTFLNISICSTTIGCNSNQPTALFLPFQLPQPLKISCRLVKSNRIR
ncbi:hypothetical protein D3C77_553820 [compost metagenome]